MEHIWVANTSDVQKTAQIRLSRELDSAELEDAAAALCEYLDEAYAEFSRDLWQIVEDFHARSNA